jgi:L-amino acid N-acyltransferase YncA
MDTKLKLIKQKKLPDFTKNKELLNAIWPKEFGHKTYEEKVEAMINSFNKNTDIIKYLYSNKDIIGFYRFSLWPRNEKETKTAHTFDIAILPSYQKERLGTMLMMDMVNECRTMGLQTLLSRSFKSNIPSIRLHKSLNFLQEKETEDSIVWKMNL